MLNHLLPRHADNTYRGHKVALWLFGLVVSLRVVMGFNSMLNARYVASSADGIPLDTFPPAAAQTAVSLFALLGLSNLVIALLGVLVLVRYRTLVPFMFVLLLLHHLARQLIFAMLPIPRTGAPPGSVISFVLLGLMVVGLALSLWRVRKD
jgi:hypothetical protein